MCWTPPRAIRASARRRGRGFTSCRISSPRSTAGTPRSSPSRRPRSWRRSSSGPRWSICSASDEARAASGKGTGDDVHGPATRNPPRRPCARRGTRPARSSFPRAARRRGLGGVAGGGAGALRQASGRRGGHLHRYDHGLPHKPHRLAARPGLQADRRATAARSRHRRAGGGRGDGGCGDRRPAQDAHLWPGAGFPAGDPQHQAFRRHDGAGGISRLRRRHRPDRACRCAGAALRWRPLFSRDRQRPSAPAALAGTGRADHQPYRPGRRAVRFRAAAAPSAVRRVDRATLPLSRPGAGRGDGGMTTLLWIAIAAQTVMGAFDTIWHHEGVERLAWRPSQAHELRLHGVRNMIYALVFAALGWSEPRGPVAWALIALLLVELIITLWDFVEEDRTRHLPASERITHTLQTLNYGVILTMLVPLLLGWAACPPCRDEIAQAGDRH